jgi:hypothetical protein
VHHRTILIYHHSNATIFKFIILKFVYRSTCFGRFPASHQELNDCSGSLWFYLRIVVTGMLCSWSGRPNGMARMAQMFMNAFVRSEGYFKISMIEDSCKNRSLLPDVRKRIPFLLWETYGVCRWIRSVRTCGFMCPVPFVVLGWKLIAVQNVAYYVEFLFVFTVA